MRELRGPWNKVPKPYRLPVVFVGALLVMVGVTDFGGALVLALFLGAIFGLLVATERWARRRARARRTAMPYGTGLWRARVEPLDVPGLSNLRFSLSWFADAVTVDLRVESSSLRVEPSSAGRHLMRLRPMELRWEDIAEARVGERVHELGGKPLVASLHEVRLVMVGEEADDVYEPISDEEAAEEGLSPTERAELDAEELAFCQEEYGEDWVPGTRPVRLLLLEDAEGFADCVRRYARGRLPSA